MQEVDVNDAKTRLPDLIEAAINGEQIVITKDNLPMAKLVPISRHTHRPQFGSARGLITMSDDFDEPIDDFEVYMR